MFPVVEVFGKESGLYGIMAALGLLVCGFSGWFISRKRLNLDITDYIVYLVVIVLGIAIGGKLMYFITHTGELFEMISDGRLAMMDFSGFFNYFFGGNVFYGGFIGACLALIIYSRFTQKRVTVNTLETGEALDLFACFTPLFHVFGRIGCFFGGCCYGIESTFGFTVHGNTLNPLINDVNRFPVQLLEAACNLVIFALILGLYLKKKMQNRCIYIYMIIYGFVRFGTEFFRGDEIRGFLWILSTSQWVSLGLIIFAIVKLITYGSRN
ncbi:MAG: prolipoprotein diacylglyceryl transferase, partial [Parasporobacterium sp.]|nr:prolipoprotein diacylglyceryl transferase [Parasporobacterium sp.]